MGEPPREDGPIRANPELLRSAGKGRATIPASSQVIRMGQPRGRAMKLVALADRNRSRLRGLETEPG